MSCPGDSGLQHLPSSHSHFLSWENVSGEASFGFHDAGHREAGEDNQKGLESESTHHSLQVVLQRMPGDSGRGGLGDFVSSETENQERKKNHLLI